MSALRKCTACAGALGTCVHGDIVDRAVRALHRVADERAKAEQRKRAGLPVNVQEGGEAYDLAGKAEGVSGTYVRRLNAIREADRDLFERVVDAKELSISEAWLQIRKPGDPDDSDTWLTPAYVVEAIRKQLGGCIDLDPCTIACNPVGATTFFSKQRDANEDGLTASWAPAKTVYCNPPYSYILPWLKKAVDEGENGVAVLVLIPASVSSAYGQYALQYANDVLFPDRRISFLRADGSSAGSPAFDCMICAFGAATTVGLEISGTVVVRKARAA